MPHVCNKKKFEIFFNDTISISKLILVGRNMILAGIDPPEVKKYPQNDVKKKCHIMSLWNIFARTCQRKSVYNCMRGGARPILTNAFLEQMRNNLENLLNTKVFKVTKGCLKKLARAKNEIRAQKNKSRFLEQLILPTPPIFRNCVPAPNHAFRGAQNSLNRHLFQYLTLKQDLHTLRAGFAEFRPQKFLYYLSKLLKYASVLFFTLHELKKWKVWKKSY